MDENKHPHLKLVDSSDCDVPNKPELHHYVYDETYNYDLGMKKSDVKLLVAAGVLMGVLLGVVAVGIFGGLALLL